MGTFGRNFVRQLPATVLLYLASLALSSNSLAKEFSWEVEAITKTPYRTCTSPECNGLRVAESIREDQVTIKGLGRATVHQASLIWAPANLPPGSYEPCYIEDRSANGWQSTYEFLGSHSVVIELERGDSIALEKTDSSICLYLGVSDANGELYLDALWDITFAVTGGTGNYEEATGTLTTELYFKRLSPQESSPSFYSIADIKEKSTLNLD